MTNIYLRAFLAFLPLFFAFFAFGQINDECANAIAIADPENFCSAVGAGTNLNATESNVPPSACSLTNPQDVWFSFVAIASEATVTIRGNTFDTPGGTLQLPRVTLYSGTCGVLTELACQVDPGFNNNIVELVAAGLTPGETYYFRVDGVFPGTFQYCLRNYFFGGTLSGDCPTAVVLCNKESFNVAAVAGPGSNPNEMDDAPCFGGFFAESNSTWYVFTAANNGTLEFTLTPNNATDDIDFIVYRLPNGVGNCAGKVVLRCMAAGDFGLPSPCMGPTGLRASSTDLSEQSGCNPGQDNFLAALNMTAGTTYVLAVNNFTSSGNGFQIDWGGTDEFVGLDAGFISDKADSICLGERIVFTDTSKVDNGLITAWHWNFGVGAQPDTANTQGPQTVRYATAGSKIVSLRVETSTGCDVTTTRTILVDTCCVLSAMVQFPAECPMPCSTATIIATDDLPPVTYMWSTNQTDSLVTDLTPGDYIVTVTDATGCTDTVAFTIEDQMLFIPNAFTPNGDNVNDVFFPGGSNFEVLELEVYSRWGKKVWSGTSGGWDGRLDGQELPSDVYAYRGRVRFQGEVQEKKGEVMLLR